MSTTPLRDLFDRVINTASAEVGHAPSPPMLESLWDFYIAGAAAAIMGIVSDDRLSSDETAEMVSAMAAEIEAALNGRGLIGVPNNSTTD